jgi:diacylglycerol kinase (ATP)
MREPVRPAGLPRHARNHPFRHSLRFAWQGVSYTWRTQRNFRTESAIGATATLACLALGVSPAPVLVCAALVLSLELINTAFEAVVDMYTSAYHPLAKVAKDVAAAAVLVASGISVLVGISVLGPPIWGLLVGG